MILWGEDDGLYCNVANATDQMELNRYTEDKRTT